PAPGPVLDAHENAVVAAGGTVLRYGLFYGPATFFESEPPSHPRIHIDDAARRTMPFLAGPRGIFTITDQGDESGPAKPKFLSTTSSRTPRSCASCMSRGIR